MNIPETDKIKADVLEGCSPRTCAQWWVEDKVYFCRLTGKVCPKWEEYQEQASERDIESRNERERDCDCRQCRGLGA